MAKSLKSKYMAKFFTLFVTNQGQHCVFFVTNQGQHCMICGTR